MTKRMKKYSGRLTTTAGVLVALGLLIWALASIAGYATVVNTYSNQACTNQSSTFARGTDNVFSRMTGCQPGATYRAEYWGPSTDNGADLTMRSRALNNMTSTSTTTGMGSTLIAKYATGSGDNGGIWQVRLLHNPNYSAAGRIVIDTPMGAFAAGTVAANTIKFHIEDRDGNIIKDIDCRQAASAGGANLTVTLSYATGTTWTNVFNSAPMTTTNWAFNSSTGQYSYTATFTATAGNRYRFTVTARDPNTGNALSPSTGHSRYQMGWGATTEYARGNSTAAGSSCRTGGTGSYRYWKCIQANTNIQPGVTAGWQSYWSQTYVTNTTTWSGTTAYTAGNALDSFAMGALTTQQYWACGTVSDTSTVYYIAPATEAGLNPRYVANPSGMTYTYDYYFDLYDRNNNPITAGTFTSTRRARGAAGYTNAPATQTSVTAGTITYGASPAGPSHWKCTFALTAPGKYTLQVPVTATNNTATLYQVINFATSKTFTMLGDSIPPANISAFTATPSDNTNTLNWTKPTQDQGGGALSGLDGVIILRKEGTITDAPVKANFGTYAVGGAIGTSTIVYIGNGTSATDGGPCGALVNGTTYSYKAFSYDSYLNFSTGDNTPAGNPDTRISGTPVDTTPPLAVSNPGFIEGNLQNTVTWINPVACDYKGVDIWYRTDGSFPTKRDGTEVGTYHAGTKSGGTPGAPDSYLHNSNVTNGVPYYYTIWAYDDETTRNYSAGASPTTYAVPHDVTPPAAVTTLDVVPGSVTAFDVTLQWTATGDDGTTGNASSYEIRYSNKPIQNETDWKNAWHTVGASLPQPLPAGSVQTYKVAGLSPMATWYFAMKVNDEVPNPSALSNYVSATTLCNPELSACNQCHLMPPDDDLPGAHPRGTGNIGAHYLPIHAGGGSAEQCNVCHADGKVWRNNTTLYMYNHQNDKIDINGPGKIGNKFEREQDPPIGGTFYAQTTIVYKYKNYSSGVGYKQITGYCQNTYCHGAGLSSPRWGLEGIVCGEYCHETPPATGRHIKHYHPGQYYLNFGPKTVKDGGTSPDISGYTNDDGSSGWSGSVSATNRGSNPAAGGSRDARYATFISSSNATKTFLLPNGTWYVTACVGDPSGARAGQNVEVSGNGGTSWVKMIDNFDTLAVKLFKKDVDRQVIVTGGNNLIVKIGNGSTPTDLNFVIINATPEAPKANTTLLQNTPSEYGFACGKCHVADATQARHTNHVGGPVQRNIRDAENAFDANSFPKNPFGNYTRVADASSPDGFTIISSFIDGQGFNYTNGRTCVNTYCHGGTLRAGGTNHSPTWKDGYIDVSGASLCGSCHDAGYADSSPLSNMTTGSHSEHTNKSAAYRFDCYKCHNHTVGAKNAGTGVIPITDKTHHVNGDVDVIFDPNDNTMKFGRYSTAQKTCRNIYCHSNGLLNSSDQPFSKTTYATPVWASGSKPCNYCHGTSRPDGMPDYASFVNATAGAPNSHAAHVDNNKLGCSKCHNNTTRNNGVSVYTTIQPSLHVNGTSDVTFDAENPTGQFNHSNLQCTTTYCHGQTQAPTWGGVVECGDCHGDGAVNPKPVNGKDAHSAHNNGAYSLATSVVTNSSDATNYNYTCNFCHFRRTHGGGEKVAGLQTAETNFNTVNASNGYNNTGWTYTTGAVINDSLTGWHYSAGTCSTKCHSSNAAGGAPNNAFVTWTSKFMGTARECYTCHNGDASAPAGRRMRTGKHAMHVFSSVYRRGCGDCHDLTASNSIITDKSKHVNGSVQVSLNAAYGGTYDGSKNCNNVYCHSNADPSAWGGGTMYYKSMNWSTGPATSCTSCHSNNHVAGGDGVRSESQTLSFNHREHLNSSANSGYGSRIGCTNCHNLTARTNLALVTTIVPSRHNNMNKDIFFESIAGFKEMSGLSTSYLGGGDGTAYWGQQNVPNAGDCTVICHSDGRGGQPIRFPNWSTPENSYGCTSCHAADAATFALPNYTANSFAHVTHLNNGLTCNTCHRLTASSSTMINASGFTSHHVNGSAANDVKLAIGTAGSYDPVTKSCSSLSCHGFRNWTSHVISTCNSCHDSPPRYAQHFAHYSAASMGNLTGVKVNSNVNKTSATSYMFGCGKCHTLAATSHKGGNVSTNQVAEVKFDATVNPMNPLGKYTSLGALWSTDRFSKTYTAGTCKNLYCHSNGQSGGLARYSSIKWSTVSVSCTSCHGSATTNTLSASHNKHVNTLANSSYNIGCAQCHKKTVTSNTAISNKTNHVNGVKDLYFQTFGSMTGSYNLASKTCTVTYCHSDGTGITKATVWGTSMTCTSCHNYTKGSGSQITTNAHGAHINNTDANLGSFRCVDCHADTVNANNTTILYNNGLHVNGTKNINFVDKSLNNHTGAYVSGTSTCRNNYCHSSGQKKMGGTTFATLSTPVFRAPVWTGAATGCNVCHGVGSTYGEPNYTNRSTAGTMSGAWFNGHATHAKSQTSCYNCHNLTVGSDGITMIAGTKHIDGSIQVSFSVSGGGTYYPATKRCNVPSCHGTTTVRWGGKLPNSCQSCHSDMGAGGYTNHSTTGKHLKHTNSTTYRFACENCHKAMDTTGNTAHAGGNVSTYQTAEVKFRNTSTTWDYVTYGGSGTQFKYIRMDTMYGATAAPAPSYKAASTITPLSDKVVSSRKYTQGRCTNVWCHSNANPLGGANTYVAYPNWSTAETTTCRSCHAGDSSAAPTMSTGSHTQHVNNGDLGKFLCTTCHTDTVKGNSSVYNYNYHVNGVKNVNFTSIVLARYTGFYVSATNTCRNTYCHSSGQASSGTLPNYSTPVSTSPVWNGTALDCKGCHGIGSTFGQPNYTNRSTASRAWFNGHGVAGHISTAADCSKCHRGTVNVLGNLSTGTTKHINGTRDLNFRSDVSGVTYNSTNKSCTGAAGASCHASSTVRWGGTANCQTCHGVTTAETDDYVYSGGSGTKATINMDQYTSVGHGKLGSYRYSGSSGASNSSKGARQVASCETCHDSAVAHGTTGNFFRVRGGGNADTLCTTALGCHDTATTALHTKALTGGNAGWEFTPKCVDCHDPHGDNGPNGRHNNYMIQGMVNYSTSSSTDGIPTFTKAVNFPANVNLPVALNYSSYARSNYSGLCQICHSGGGNPAHYSKSLYETEAGHSGGNVCTQCHSHGSGFQGSGDCTGCHAGAQNSRRAMQPEFDNSSSHHIVGNWASMTKTDCAACHAEGNYADGSSTALHTGKSGHPVYLKRWTAAITAGSNGTFTVISTNRISTDSSVLTPFCLGCHSDTNKAATPFSDGKTPGTYAWDNNSVGSKYSNISTTPWGKFDSSTLNVVPADTVAKAFSPHGQTGKNDMVMSITTFKSYSGTKAVQCYDCHNAHSSNVAGATSYVSGNNEGGIIKTTGTYTPRSGGSSANKNAFASDAALCFDCHLGDNATAPKKYTDYGLPTGRSIAGSYYDRVGNTKVWDNWSTSRWSSADVWRGSFAYKDGTFKGGHFGNSRGYLQGTNIGTKINDGKGGKCVKCHDPHGVSPAIGRGYTKASRTVYAAGSTAADPVMTGSYSGTARDSYIYVVRISTAGALGTAQYQASADGGKNWGAATSTSTAYASNGITLTFQTGNYSVDDTWTYLAGPDPQYMVPALKGTWMHSPYKEDRAPRSDHSAAGGRLASVPRANDFTAYNPTMGNRRWYDDTSGGTAMAQAVGAPAPRANPDFKTGSYVPGYNIPAVQGDGFGQGPIRNYGFSFSNITSMNGWNGYFIDENTFGQTTLKGYAQNSPYSTMSSINAKAVPGRFAGLCLKCHAWSKNGTTAIALSNVTSANLGNGTVAGAGAKVRTKPHETVMGLGTITVDLFQRAVNPGSTQVPMMAMHNMTYNSSSGTSGGPGTPYNSSTNDPTAGSGRNMHYYRWGVIGNTQATSGTIQGKYHRFPCSKCHTPHTSRLPRLMKTNCLDNDNVGTSHTTMGYVSGTTLPGTAGATLPGALARNVACHSTKIGATNGSNAYYQGGWNNKTPW